MATQTQVHKFKNRDGEEHVKTDDLYVKDSEGRKVYENMDDLLDEIDGVLEANAEEFVQGYVQKGGQ
jgi:ubiquitin-like protein Pup